MLGKTFHLPGCQSSRVQTQGSLPISVTPLTLQRSTASPSAFYNPPLRIRPRHSWYLHYLLLCCTTPRKAKATGMTRLRRQAVAVACTDKVSHFLKAPTTTLQHSAGRKKLHGPTSHPSWKKHVLFLWFCSAHSCGLCFYYAAPFTLQQSVCSAVSPYCSAFPRAIAHPFPSAG